ncbi:MAG TPA: LCP family protein [Paenibacillus sp.]|uniref:LCP family protein n=1 Tax=Paenibacillus sp. TaxID=58172 RepID=UPI002BF297CD|nr:LCP family protein [Paenibacillus sp.]HUC93157.1 LCP family protein [Paenibacillus sp.]
MNSGTNLPPRGASRQAYTAPASGRRFRWGRFFFILFFLVLLAAAGFLAYLFFETKGAITDMSTDNNNGEVTVVPQDQSVKVKPTAMLLLGLDNRKETGSMNTDVLMVAAFNPETKSAVVVSIPRDTRIELDGFSSRKANQYYSRFLSAAREKDGLEGIAAETEARNEMKEMFGQYFDIPIQYSAVINFKGFSDVVDALGGVEVNVDMDMRYRDTADGTDIDLKAGFQELDGNQALDFVRYRKSNNGTGESSDFERNQRQSQVLGALTDKMKSLGGVAKLGSVIEAVGNNMTMDMPSKEIEALMTTYFGIGKENIQFIPLEGTWRSPYVYPDETKLSEAKAALRAKLAE